jgi:N6-adenosine-specific RNA methylase IME4
MWWIGDWYLHGEGVHDGKPVEQAVEEIFGVTRARETVRQAAWVCSAIPFVTRVTSCSFTHHREAATLPEPQRMKLLKRAVREDLSSRDFKKLVRDAKRGAKGASPLPDGVFDVVYADPPWHYDYAPGPKRTPDSHYATMSVEDICDIPVPAADDAVLFLWAVGPLVREALRVMAAWDFEYKSQAVWDKGMIGMGYWFRGEHELLLVGTKGNMPPPPEGERRSSMIRVKRSRKHSEKPGEVYDLIEGYFPKARRLEMFARAARRGWTAWGDEV